MGWLDSVLDRAAGPSYQRAWPVGRAEVYASDSTWGHDDSRFSPESNEEYAIENSVFTVLTARARLMQDVELHFFNKKGIKKKKIEDHRSVELYDYVNPYWSRERLDRMDELCMGIWGETFWHVGPPTRESPMGEIWWLKPSRMFPLFHDRKYIVGYRYQGITGEWLYFEPHEIIWFRYPNFIDEKSPLPPLIAAKLAAETAQAMVKSNRQLFAQGLQVAGLVFPANPDTVWTTEQVNGMETFLRRKFTTSEKANRWAVLRQEAKFQQISMTPKDAEFLGGLNLNFRQVCRVFGMQATLLGDLEQASPGDTENLERIEWARTLAPDAKLRASEIKEQYLPLFLRESGAPRHCEPDFTRVPAMQRAETEMWEREAGQVDRGLMTGNEWRRRRGWDDVPWGEFPWLPMNKGQYLPLDEEPKGKLVIPGQDPNMFGGGFGGEAGNSADAGWPAQAQQGGPIDLGEDGVPSEVLPDDERSPVNGRERASSHQDARAYLAREDVRDWLDWVFKREGISLNGHNGKRPLSLTR